MEQRKQDKLLTLIDKGYQVTSKGENRRYLKELENQGLIHSQGENSYNLTRYGEMIKVMGFEVHEETERFEQELSWYTPRKRRLVKVLLLGAFFLLMTILLMIVCVDLDTIFGNLIWNAM